MKIILDFETYSPVPISAGSVKYTEHPDADIICMGYKVENEPTLIWRPGDEIYPVYPEDVKVYAHNALFDYLVWCNIGIRQYGFPPIPLENWVDTMALATRYTLPAALAKAGAVLDVEVQKGIRGRALVKKICMPTKLGDRPKIGRDFTHAEYLEFLDYCSQDVESTYHLVKNLPSNKLSDEEQKCWLLTQKINLTGLPVDINAANKILNYIEGYVEEMTLRVPEITDGKIQKVTQVAKMVAWLQSNKVDVQNLQAATVESLLAGTLHPHVRELLELRQALGRSSTAKYRKIREMEHDGRIFNNLIYYGASTGRWTGSGFQLHNLPRASVENPVEVIECFINFRSVSDPVNVAKALIRPMIKASKGMILIISDYAAIENCLIMWVADDQNALASIRAGRDQYIEMAAYLYQTDYVSIKQGYLANDGLSCHRRRIGKIIVLGCGFQMGGKRFRESALEQGVELSSGESFAAVNAFRAKHSMLKKMWTKLSRSCIAAIQNPGKVYGYHECYFRVVKCRASNRWLVCTLPSGRNLFYMDPFVDQDAYGNVPGHHGINPYSKKWTRRALIPGRITENIIQALARDIMAHGLMKIDQEMPEVALIGTVHDEAIGEINKANVTPVTLDQFNNCLCSLPAWATGLPLKAEGWIGERYKK